MSTLVALRIYFAINGLLIASLLLFKGLDLATRKVKARPSHRQWIAVAQALIAVSLIAPFALQAVPRERLSGFDWHVFQPDADGAGISKYAVRKEKTSAPPEPKPLAEPVAESWRVIVAHGLAALRSPAGGFGAWLFIIAGIAGSLAVLSRSAGRLRGTLRRAAAVRAVGQVRVVVSDEVVVPFSTRIGSRSWVVLPSSMLENARDFRIALRHELQHHRQRDTSWAIFIEVLACVFFANPAVRSWKREITELQEFSCDEALIGRAGVSSHDYGSCLVRVAEAALGARQVHVGTTCMAAVSKNPFYFKSFLRRRIEMFTKLERRKAPRWAGALVGTLAAVLTFALAFGAEKSLRGSELLGLNPGQVVVDPEIQEIADRALRESIAKEKATGGFAIVAEPSSGRILAVANVDTTGEFRGHWALNRRFETASIGKVLVVSQAIESGLTHPQESHFCENGSYRYGGRVYHDWKTGGWDHLTTEETIAFSGDICTIKIGERVGDAGLRKMLVDFGFGPAGSARSFPEARTGVLPPTSLGTAVPLISAGYGFQATALELIQAYGAIANGGKLLMPKLANASSEAQVVRRILSPETADKVKEILRQVVLKGTAKGKASSELYSTAGKTASGFTPDLTKWDLVEGKKKANFAGFIGFAPVKDPRVEIYVGVLNPKSGGKGGAHGSAHAAPVFKRIAEEVLQQMRVAPDLSRNLE